MRVSGHSQLSSSLELCTYVVGQPRTYTPSSTPLASLPPTSPSPFLPSQIRCRGHGDADILPEALKYIRETWPWWNATGGARHAIIHTGAWGANYASLPLPPPISPK